MASAESQCKAKLLSIGEFVSELRKIPAGVFDNARTLDNVLRVHLVDPETLTPYLQWDRQHYTRNLIDKTSIYELIAICWEPGQGSSIHNHQDQNCWMASPTGRLVVQNYRVVRQDLEHGKCKIEPTNTVEINQKNPVAVDPLEPVHRVYNPAEFKQRAVSLHVYSRPFDTCIVYSEQGTCGVIKLQYTT
jgi:cysteine dioxygenase